MYSPNSLIMHFHFFHMIIHESCHMFETGVMERPGFLKIHQTLASPCAESSSLRSSQVFLRRLRCEAPQPTQKNLRRAQRGGFCTRRRQGLMNFEKPWSLHNTCFKHVA